MNFETPSERRSPVSERDRMTPATPREIELLRELEKWARWWLASNPGPPSRPLEHLLAALHAERADPIPAGATGDAEHERESVVDRVLRDEGQV
jgi:hypothetical protein